MTNDSPHPQSQHQQQQQQQQQQQIPREAKLASLLLSTSGINECEPKVIQQVLEFIYRYTTDVLQESMVYSEHAGKNELDLEDLRLGIKSQLRHMFVQPPSRDFLLDLAMRKNSQPLPIFDDKPGLRLPPDQNTLLGSNYKITSLRRPMPRVMHPSNVSMNISREELHQQQQQQLNKRTLDK